VLIGRGHLLRLAVLAGMVVLLAACGAVATSQSSASSLPGQGKPTIVLGDKGSGEQLLLGELYAQAFRALGYIVVLEHNIGGTQQINTAFQSGQINAYPEYLGELAATDAGHTAPLTSESQAEQIAQQYEQGHGATAMMPVTPFSNTDELITLESFAKQRNLTTIEQLKGLPFRLKFGDYAAEETRYGGYMGLQQAYGLTNLQFVPLPTGSSIYDALDTHLVQVGDAFLTDPQLAGGTYAVLSDPKNIFGFQHVALIINTSWLNRLGPQFQQIYSSVTNLLTLSAMQALNRAVALDNQIPASVAHSFLLANHLASS
jgi:osmoprotectant transport system substrate-binding protein